MSGQEEILVLCDHEETYLHYFGEYLCRAGKHLWRVRMYSGTEELLSEEDGKKIALLVVSEGAYSERLKSLQSRRIVVLNESGILRWENVSHINKFQEASAILRELLELYTEVAPEQFPRLRTDGGTRFVGFFSPVHRSMQTCFAMTMGQILSEKNTVLYLNFEYCSGLGGFWGGVQDKDLSDLLYFLTAEKEKFHLRLRTMTQSMGSLDYIPPVRLGQNLLTISPKEWLSLLRMIADLAEYEYVLLDLSECVQGLFDVMRMCEVVYTMAEKDRMAQCKLDQFEQALKLCEYEDVWLKTRSCRLPRIKKIPDFPEEYSRSELGELVKREMKGLYGRE